jgi:hypothetical protein
MSRNKSGTGRVGPGAELRLEMKHRPIAKTGAGTVAVNRFSRVPEPASEVTA